MAVGGRDPGDPTESSDPVVRLKVTGVHRLLAFGTLFLSVACGSDKEPTGPDTTQPAGPDATQPVIASIVVSPASVTLDRWGDTVSLVVRGLDAGGSFVSTIPAMWRTSDSTVAKVDSDGVVSSWLAGDAILTAAITPPDPGLPSSITVPVTVATDPRCDGPSSGPFCLRLMAEGLAVPFHLTSPPGYDWLVIVEAPGLVLVLEGDSLLPEPFLDLRNEVNYPTHSEQGLLGLEFDPNFEANGIFYANGSVAIFV